MAVSDLYNKATQLKKKTEGGKTTAATIVWFGMQLVNTIKPDAISPEIQVVIYNGAELLAAIGLLDKVWRNREKIIGWVKDKFTKDK